MAHMDVLLREDVENLGQRGQVVRVRTGYGRNYLLPQGLAIAASAGNKKKIEEERRVLAKREDRERAAAQGHAANLEGLVLRFERRVGEHGILFGSVTVLDIVEGLRQQGYEVERRRVNLPQPIKEIGEYDVVIKLHREVTPTVKVLVRKEGAPEETPAAAAPAEEAATDATTTAAADASAGAAEAGTGDETSGEATQE